MSENNASNRKLTLDDPVGADTLEKLRELEGVEIDAAMQLMALEQTKIKLLAAGRRVEDERHRAFEKLLMERGLAPNTPATIDAGTGKITLVHPQGQAAEAPKA